MKIVHYPHPALRHQARPLTSIDKKLHLHIGKMWDLMYEARGLGLAATQVALPYQFLLMNITGDPDQKDREEIYINPVIVERKGSTLQSRAQRSSGVASLLFVSALVTKVPPFRKWERKNQQRKRQLSLLPMAAALQMARHRRRNPSLSSNSL